MTLLKSSDEVLAELQDLDAAYPELSIIKISEPIASSADLTDGSKRNQLTPSKQRTSDVSTDAFDNPTPASLEADLTHYKVSLRLKLFDGVRHLR